MKYEIVMHIHTPGPLYESEEIEINGRKDRSIDHFYIYYLYIQLNLTHYFLLLHNHNSNYV